MYKNLAYFCACVQGAQKHLCERGLMEILIHGENFNARYRSENNSAQSSSAYAC